MGYVVLKPFFYAKDGFTLESLKPGVEREFGDVAEGLLAEDFIGAPGQTDLPSADVDAPAHTEPEDAVQVDEDVAEIEAPIRRGRPKRN